MRGEHRDGADMTDRDWGIIPACAGSTGMLWRLMALSLGSSPHARGAPGEELVLPKPRGIIPACAGSTSEDGVSIGVTPGSSPHARGARSR